MFSLRDKNRGPFVPQYQLLMESLGDIRCSERVLWSLYPRPFQGEGKNTRQLSSQTTMCRKEGTCLL